MNSSTRITKLTAVRPRTGFDRHTSAHWAAVGLAAFAGAIQLSLAWTDGLFLFVLPAAVLFAGVVSAVAGVNQRLLYALGVPFIAAQLFAGLMQGLPGFERGVLALTVQAVLFGLLAALLWSGRVAVRNERRAVHDR